MTWLAVRLFLQGILGRLWAFLRSLPWQVWLGVAIVALGLFWGHLRYGAGQADVQKKFDSYKLSQKTEADKQAAAARQKEAHWAADFAKVAATYAEEKANGFAKKDAVIADLRAGTLKLRHQWQGCPSLSATAGDSARSDEDAELRRADSGDLIRVGSDANAEVKACQARLKAERQ